MTTQNSTATNPLVLLKEGKLVWKLSKNDFKTKFAGSYLGTIWAFVQPVVTILVYWFVFEKALGSQGQITRDGIEAPFVIWLMAGLVPWFFFQDALTGGTAVLQEYDYLVKKVVFQIHILPVVKMISALLPGSSDSYLHRLWSVSGLVQLTASVLWGLSVSVINRTGLCHQCHNGIF